MHLHRKSQENIEESGGVGMVDYSKIITELTEESESCNYRYGGMVPLYYQQQISEAVAALIECQESQMELCKPSEGAPHDPYKTDQLMKMLAHETEEGQEHYGARLHHEASGANVLTIDAGGLRALISYYATHRTDLGNGEED